ncbi:MAG TPA: RNA polymerase sigma factor [Myxococcaceae bacterium]|nr:RNA polymerase sigma factor [Myxococcaceae bacterium]
MVSTLDAFISRIRPWLLIQARKLCRNHSDAEDLVQEGCLRFLNAFAQLERLPPENECEAWLITTMTNCFYDQCRKREVEKRRQADPALEEVSVGQRANPKSPYDQITDKAFADAVKQLSPGLRSTFELFAAGKRYREIAQRQGLTVGAVGKRLSDARSKLKEIFSATFQQGEH